MSGTKWRRADSRHGDGTSFHGDVLTMSYVNLVARLGEPDPGDGIKTRAEWTIVNDNGLAATIYDWKADGEVGDVLDWNVGAKHPLTAKAAITAISDGRVSPRASAFDRRDPAVQLMPLADAAQRTVDTIAELAARWHRHDTAGDDHFGAGLRAGWAQAIGLLSGVEYADVVRQLQAGEL
jgi:hypothetical protein